MEGGRVRGPDIKCEGSQGSGRAGVGVDTSPGTGDGAWSRTQWILFLYNVNIRVPE